MRDEGDAFLALPRPRIHSQHQEQNVHAAQDVEYLEDGVPGRVELEDVEVAGHEDAAVEGLRDEGDAFGALVAVDGEDEDAFREGVRDVAEDAEDLEEGGRVSATIRACSITLRLGTLAIAQEWEMAMGLGLTFIDTMIAIWWVVMLGAGGRAMAWSCE